MARASLLSQRKLLSFFDSAEGSIMEASIVRKPLNPATSVSFVRIAFCWGLGASSFHHITLRHPERHSGIVKNKIRVVDENSVLIHVIIGEFDDNHSFDLLRIWNRRKIDCQSQARLSSVALIKITALARFFLTKRLINCQTAIY